MFLNHELLRLTLMESVTTPIIDTELLDPASIAPVRDYEKRSAPDTNIEIPDPGAINAPAACNNTNSTNIEKRGAPDTNINFFDSEAVYSPVTSKSTQLTDIEKRGVPNTDIEILDPEVNAPTLSKNTESTGIEKRAAPNTASELLDPEAVGDSKKISPPNVDIEILDLEVNQPALLVNQNTKSSDIKKRSAPNIDEEISDPIPVNLAPPPSLTNTGKRAAPGIDDEIQDPAGVTSVLDFEKGARPITDNKIDPPACVACDMTLRPPT